MIDVFNIPNNNNNIQVFYSAGPNNWQIWRKPKNCSFINMFLIGGGGGGGGGREGGNGGGGGGGGSSSVCQALFIANVLPDILYVQVGLGGTGGNGGGSGTATNGLTGGLSYVSLFPSATTSSLISNTSPIILASGDVGASGGTQSSSGGAGGVGGTVFSITSAANNFVGALGVQTTIGGQNGGAAATTSSNASNLSLVSIVSGGAGGGSTSTGGGTLYSPGSVLGNQYNPNISGGTVTSVNGNNGYSYLPLYLSGNRLPFISMGGGGGAASSTGPAGVGGNGSYGSGGGGGGGAYSLPGTASKGGNGGDGIVIITAW